MKRLLTLLVLSLFCSSAHAQRYAPPKYQLIELPGPATALSDTGWVVGTAGNAGYRWRDGVLEVLPDLAAANGVNAHGDVVGWAVWTETPEGYAASLVDGVRTFYRGQPTSLAYGINDDGLVVGANVDNYFKPAAWRDGLFALSWNTTPGYLAGEARAVNSQGWIVGWSGYFAEPGIDDDRPTMWKGDRIIYLKLPPGAVGARATSVSDTGVVGGFYGDGDALRPYLMDLWSGTSVEYPQIASGEVLGVNDRGVGVGDVALQRAVIYGPDGSVWRLQNLIVGGSKVTLTRALDIDNLGRIAGETNKGGFLLVPVVP